MRGLVGTVNPDDYPEIQQGVQAVKRSTAWFKAKGARQDLPHTHRLWEYGSGVQALLSIYHEHMSDIEVLDVGSGCSPFGPALALNYNLQVTECEPNLEYRQEREKVNAILQLAGKKKLNVLDGDLTRLPVRQYDAVFCISVIEHVPNEAPVWQELAKHVKVNGLLYITVDCVEDKQTPCHFDNMRSHKFTCADMEQKVNALQSIGMVTMGMPDYVWHGKEVFDYSFFRMGLVKVY